MLLIALASSRGRPAIRSVTRCSFAAWQLLELCSGLWEALWTARQGNVLDAGASACDAARVSAISRQGHPARHLPPEQNSCASHATPPATQQQQQRAATTRRQRSVAQNRRDFEMRCCIWRSCIPNNTIFYGVCNRREPATTRTVAAAKGSNLESPHRLEGSSEFRAGHQAAAQVAAHVR